MERDYSVHVNNSGTQTIGGSIVGSGGNAHSGPAHQTVSIQQVATENHLPRLLDTLSAIYHSANSATDLPVSLRDDLLDRVEFLVALLNERDPDFGTVSAVLSQMHAVLAPWTSYGSGISLKQQVADAHALTQQAAG